MTGDETATAPEPEGIRPARAGRPAQAVARLSAPIRVVLGLAIAAVGVAFLLVSMTVQTIALVTGIGIFLVGVAVLLVPGDREEAAGSGSRSLPVIISRVLGALLVLLGAGMALWPAAGAPLLAQLLTAALIVFAVATAVRALRPGADQRVTGIIAALATLAVAAITVFWPVLTLVVFRLGVGAWFVFIGLQLVVRALWQRSPRPHAAAPRRGVRWLRTIGATVALVLAVALAAGSGALLGGTPLPVPDAFYTPPATVPSAPGTLIRSEPMTIGVPAGAKAWRILYTTTHPDGSPAVSSGTVLAPADPGPDPLPLLTVAHGTVGVVPGCAPSLSAAPFADGAGTAMVDMVTKHGWVAVTSDYIGLGTKGPHPYLVGDAEARNVWDASKAVLGFDAVKVSTDTVIWGHSQGGQGSLWTGQIASSYAPEFTVKGIAAFAPASDLYALAEAIKTETAGKTVSAYIAATWDRVFPELEVEENLTPGSAGPVERIGGLCFNGHDGLAAILRGSQVPNQIFPNTLLGGPFGEKLKEQEPTGPFPAPLLVAQGLADPLVKPAIQHAWVQGRCDAGIPIDYRTYPGLGHVELVGPDSPLTPQLEQWTLDRWDGKAPTPDCDHLPVG
ncbi:putative Triacylglycerol lipase [Microbacterium sp. 8M]|uniref:lipase family protein n=1 Tax=Microbacterium sp. 8M TaxID=2653153 RepID=UPI0012F43EDA|nr:lipase family protein [Microbacterium sp. 8M]VXB85512.1 putative Triacylglycerol lipase [Microbacterium sp. 8M]